MDLTSYRISEKSIERIAQVAVLSVPGTMDIDAKLAGLAGRSFPRVDAIVDRSTGSVALDVEIVTTYPAPVTAITDEVRATVGTHVETLTGLSVSRVNISVADSEASANGVRVTRDDLYRHPVGVVPTPIEVTASVVHSPVVKQRLDLIPIEVDNEAYEHIESVDTPPATKVISVGTPAAPTVRHVTVPPLRPLASIHTPPPSRPVSVEAPEPAPVRVPFAPGPAPLRRIGITRFAPTQPVTVAAPAPLRPVEITRFAPRKQVSVPPTPQLRPIVVDRPEQLTQVSLPARKPLAAIHAPQPPYVGVTRPMPEPLRRIDVPRRSAADVIVPTAPQPRPLAPITISEDNLDATPEEVQRS